MKTTIFFSLAVLATAFVAASAAGSFCDTADDKVLCTQLVGGAKSWGEAMTKALNGVQQQAAAGKSVADVVAAKIPGEVKPQTKESIVSTCHWAYDNVMDNIKESIGFVKDDTTSALRTHLSAISYSDCTMGIEEFGLTVPEATQFEGEVRKLASTLLAVAEKKA